MINDCKCPECGRTVYRMGGHHFQCSLKPQPEFHASYEDHLMDQGMSDADFKDMVMPDEGEPRMKRAQGKLPHIKWDMGYQCWCAYTFNGAPRPVAIYAGFERGLPMVQRFLKKRHEAMVKRRQDQEAARKWRQFENNVKVIGALD